MITDNAQNFNGKLIVELYTKWKIKHFNSSPYRPKMIGAIEVVKIKSQKDHLENGSHLQILTQDVFACISHLPHHN